jgi:hypothetical protein
MPGFLLSAPPPLTNFLAAPDEPDGLAEPLLDGFESVVGFVIVVGFLTTVAVLF